MKINPIYKIEDFNYITAINVNKEILLSNKLLTLTYLFENLSLNSELISLPHFHQYSIIQWKYYLENFFSEHTLSFENIILEKPYFNITKSTESSLELIYIVEVVLFELLKVKKYILLPETHLQTASLNLDNLDFNNCLCLKLKLPKKFNQSSIDILIASLKNIFLVNSKIKIRFDGNQKLTSVELVLFLDALKSHFHDLSFIDFFEEPTNNYLENMKILSRYKVRYGIDESIESLINHLGTLPKDRVALVLKPSKLSISKIVQIANTYKNAYRCIISSSYEAKKTHGIAEYIAQLIPDEVHGLDTLYPLPNSLK